jgi:peroxiredoxin 2/4
MIPIIKKIIIITGMMILFLTYTNGQEIVNQRIPLIGSEAPSFNAMSTNGQIDFPEDFGKNWKVIFAHPRNFTPVCSSEIIELSLNQDDFSRLGAELIVVSTDRIDRHHRWISMLEELNIDGQDRIEINFPLVEDPDYLIANDYGMLDAYNDVGRNIRGVFFINPENTISAFYFYPNEVGRNIDEIKRTLVALQVNYNDSRALLPANWTPGDDVMISYLKDTEKEKLMDPDSEADVYRLNWFMNYKESD